MNKILTFPNPIRTVEGITEYKLDNGLTVLLFPDATARNITVNITYLVGSRHEGRGEAGMAHLLEHMLFKGTKDYVDIDTELQSRGAIYNATTWFDRTNYYETLPGTDDNLEFALKFEADRMINSFIRQEDLDAEMTVVRNEFEMGENNPTEVLHNQMFATAYHWHNYGKTTIGNRSDIERVPIKNLQAFYHHYYQPDNAVLIVAGHFNMAKAQEWIMQYLGTIPKPERVLDTTYTEEPAQDGPRHVRLQRVGELAYAALAYHIPAAAHPDFAALSVLSEVLGDEPRGLLYQSLVKSGKASEVFTSEYALKEPGLFMIFARPIENAQAPKVLLRLQKQVENLKATDIKTESVERAKTRILTQVSHLTKNTNELALKLSESIAQGDYRLFFYIRDQVKLVTADDVLRVAQTYFVESNRTSGLFIPEAAPQRAVIAPAPDVDKLLDGYCGSEEIHLGEEFEATTENIDAHTYREVLAGGTIKAAVLPKRTRGQINQARFVFRFGDEETLKGQRALFRVIPSLLRRGTKSQSFQKVEDNLHKMQSGIGIYPAYLGVVVLDASSDKTHLGQVLELAAGFMKTPRFSQKEFEIVYQRELDDLKARRSDPFRVAMMELNRLKNPFPSDSIFYAPTIEERLAELEQVTLEKAEQGYRSLYGANHMEVALVGDVELDVLAKITDLFGSWPSPVPYQQIVTPFISTIPESRTLYIPDKQMAIVALGTNFAMRDDDPHYPAMVIGNYIFGESMKSRLTQRLREKEGLSYGTKSHLNVSYYNASADITCYAMCATAKADYTLKILEEEYLKWIELGVTEQELEEAKISYQLIFKNLLADDEYVLNNLASMLKLNRTFGYYAQMMSHLEQLRAEDIHKALQIYLKNAAVAQVKAGDLKA